MIENFAKLATIGAVLAGTVVGGSALLSSDGPCKDGWKYNHEGSDGHAVHRSCYKDPWSVTLAIDSDECESALNTRDPNGVPVDCATAGY